MNYDMKVEEEKVREIVKTIKDVKIVAATKYTKAKELSKLEANGVTIFGENKVQDFLDKYEEYQGNASWHFIGTLQTNKVKYIIDKVSLIHSVNSYKLIDEIEKQANKHQLTIDILVQVNIANEESKHGFNQEEIGQVYDYIQNKPHIHMKGLMMMAPNIEAEACRKYFRETKQLLDQLIKEKNDYTLTELSMGMSQDYKVAIEEGSTMVRIGHAFFKD